MKQNLKDFLFNLIISMLIGVVVGMSYLIVKYINVQEAKELILFPILGGLIGSVSRFLFSYIVGIKQGNAIVAFVLVFIVIGGISCMPSLYYYFIYNDSTEIVELAAIIITAEFFGMSFCYYSYKRNLEFNLRLINKKKQLLKKAGQ